jgi:type IV pilus assembly protein PilW
MAIVARSNQPEKLDPVTNQPVTPNAPVWDADQADAGGAANPIVLTADANWKNYRYKVFQTLVPIRNINWMGSGALPFPQGVTPC